MPMITPDGLHLTLDGFCACTGIDRGNVAKRRQTRRLAMAWGRDGPRVPGRYSPMDVAATALGDAIAPICGVQLAAKIIRGWWYIWTDAVFNHEWQLTALSDGAKEPLPLVFFVGKRFLPGEAWFVTWGPLHDPEPGNHESVMSDLAELGDERLPQPSTFVVIRDVLTDIRDRARAAGIGLFDPKYQPFAPPWDSPEAESLRAGIVEAQALHQRMLDVVAWRRAVAIGQRTERTWLQ